MASKVGIASKVTRWGHCCLDAQDVSMLQLAVHQGVLRPLRLAHDGRLKLDLLEDAELRAVGQARLPPQQRREVPKGAALGRQDVPHELRTVGVLVSRALKMSAAPQPRLLPLPTLHGEECRARQVCSINGHRAQHSVEMTP